MKAKVLSKVEDYRFSRSAVLPKVGLVSPLVSNSATRRLFCWTVPPLPNARLSRACCKSGEAETEPRLSLRGLGEVS
jgi:hypothetical protein